MAYGAADWQTAVFRHFKIQFVGVPDNDFLSPAKRLINLFSALHACSTLRHIKITILRQ
jgi:hypothetical protein